MQPIRVMMTSALVGALALGGALVPTAAPAASAATATRFYVDCSKKASGTGTQAKPWNSVAKVNSHGAYTAGQQILIKRGTTCKGRLAPRGSGLPGAPILIGAFGKGSRPTVAGGGTGQKTGAVQLTNQHDWTISGLHVTNRGSGKFTTVYRSGVLVANTGVGRLANITVRDSVFDNITSNLADTKKGNSRQWGGISVLTYKTYGSGFDSVRISGNKVNGVGRTGITTWNGVYQGVHDTKVRIDNNSVRWARGDSIVTVGLAGGRIDHNVSAYGSNMKDCPNCGGVSPKVANAGIWPGGSRDIVIEHNEVYGQHKWGGDGEGFDIDQNAANITLQYNYAHDNEGGGVLLCGSTDAVVRFNVFENNGKSSIAFIGTYPAKNTSIYNNTIYSSRSSKANIVRTFNGKKGSGISFKNNLVYGYSAGKYLWPAKVSTSANTLVGVLGSGHPSDRKTSRKNPGLKNPGTGKVGFKSLSGYKPRKASTFAKGVAIPKSVTRDFFGKMINPAKPPRGAAG